MGMTKKQWLVEKAKKLQLTAQSLSQAKAPFPVKQNLKGTPIMAELTQLLSETQLRLLQHLEEQYGLDTRVMVARMLSEFTETATATLNIVDRMTIWTNMYNSFRDSKQINQIDAMLLYTHGTNIAWGGHLKFHVLQDARGRVAVRLKRLDDLVPDSEKNG